MNLIPYYLCLITNFFFPQVGETIMSFAGTVKTFFLDAISGIADFGKNIGSTISGAVGKTVDVAKNLGSKAMEIGGTVVSTVFNALKFIHVDLPRKLGLTPYCIKKDAYQLVYFLYRTFQKR